MSSPAKAGDPVLGVEIGQAGPNRECGGYWVLRVRGGRHAERLPQEFTPQSLQSPVFRHESLPNKLTHAATPLSRTATFPARPLGAAACDLFHSCRAARDRDCAGRLVRRRASACHVRRRAGAGTTRNTARRRRLVVIWIDGRAGAGCGLHRRSRSACCCSPIRPISAPGLPAADHQRRHHRSDRSAAASRRWRDCAPARPIRPPTLVSRSIRSRPLPIRTSSRCSLKVTPQVAYDTAMQVVDQAQVARSSTHARRSPVVRASSRRWRVRRSWAFATTWCVRVRAGGRRLARRRPLGLALRHPRLRRQRRRESTACSTTSTMRCPPALQPKHRVRNRRSSRQSRRSEPAQPARR